jgi:DNA polymerase type B, organellar and viral
MNHHEIGVMDDSKWFTALLPVKRSKSIKENPIIVGFDTEYINRDNEQITVSMQYSIGTDSLAFPINTVTSEGDLIMRKIGEEQLGIPAFPKNITDQSIFGYLNYFLVSNGIISSDTETIYLIAYFAQAEISNLEGDTTDQFQTKSKEMFRRIKSTKDSIGRGRTIKIVDLYGILKGGLDKVGDFIDLPKISLDGVGGKSETYWKQNMDELLKDHLLEFNQYANRDAEICYRAYTIIRAFFLDEYNVDILNFNTLPSIGSYIFRKHYLKEPVTPTETIRLPKTRRKTLVSGEVRYYNYPQKYEVFAGDLNVRCAALWAYHGPRTESFYIGRLEDVNLVYYDVDSLYPFSAVLQPLPNKDTEWFDLRQQKANNPGLFTELIEHGEGYIEVTFRFPDDTMYPSLPVTGARDNILYYPLDGTSWCTLSELRLAIKLGLTDYEVLRGYAFMPTDREKNHVLKQFMVDIHRLKQSSIKGSIEYELYKLIMNSLVGKMVQRIEDNTPLQLVQEGLIPGDALHKISRKQTKSNKVGVLWLPEWAALILGKSHAIISEFVAKGAYFISTDSVLLPSDTDISCDALTQLESVGSTLKREFDVTHGVLIKDRVYALNPLDESPGNRRIANLGIHLDKDAVLPFMYEGYISKQIPDLSYTRKKLTGLRESLTTDRRLNEEYKSESVINLEYGGKRSLLNPVDNPFTDGSWSRPLTDEDVHNNKQRKQPGRKVGRKADTRLNTKTKRDDITKLSRSGTKQSEICKQLGVSKGYVSKVVKQSQDQPVYTE